MRESVGKRRRGRATVALRWLATALLLPAAGAGCPIGDEGMCNGHGACGNQGECQCTDGWDGYDCGRQQCPKGAVWEYEKLTYHECSRRGHCVLGQCMCHLSFTGKACERMACQANCMHRGRCLDIETYYRDMGFPAYTAWDKNMIQGCNCEKPHNGLGYGGIDCLQFECPTGDDPMTTGQVNEKQLLTCNAPSGSFALRFPSSERGANIYHTDGIELLTRKIQSLGTREVNITFSAGSTVCNAVEQNVVAITFLQDFGRLEPLQADVAGLPDDGVSEVKVAVGGIPLGVQASVTGTKENLPCSGRGMCDTVTGDCVCYIVPMPGYRSSDGYGNPGDRGDCGAADDHKFIGNQGVVANGFKGGPIACPGEIPCSGHGICLGLPTYKCSCSAGWGTGDCSQRVCPEGWPWFPTDYYSMVTMANLEKRQRPPLEVCSNRGTCDLTRGECVCQHGFTGAACQLVELCASESAAHPCSGHGTCQSAHQQFVDAGKTDEMFAAQWAGMRDSHGSWLRYRYGRSWYSCVCEEGYTGYDCSVRTCPYGDFPNGRGVREVQLLECFANGGDFFLQYGSENTTTISAHATTAELKAALEALNAVTSVEVKFTNANERHVCHNVTAGHNVVQIYFNDYFYHYKGAYGELSVRSAGSDLPNLVAHNISNLVNTTWTVDGPIETTTDYPGVIVLAADGAALPANTSIANYSVVASSASGTRQYLECSGKGTCDGTTGLCLCQYGYASSNGIDGSRGIIPDCGHIVLRVK